MNSGFARLWLRWSWRDLRQRWVLVTALALVIALGTGAYAGLGGSTAWRLASNDASYAALKMHDLRVTLPSGGYADAGTLTAAATKQLGSEAVAAASERLIVPTLVDAGPDLLVPGEVVGVPVHSEVDTLWREDGRTLEAADAHRLVAVLESKFADDKSLPATGSLVLGGEEQVEYVGTGYSPEYFTVLGRNGQLLGETGYAVVFMPIAGAQWLTGHRGQVNDLVLRLSPDTDVGQARDELAEAVAPLGGTVTTGKDDPVHRALYEDAHNDQTMWNAFAVLILVGAAFAAFNLITRMIEAQRREMGVGMALGASPLMIVLRPLLVGVQIAVLGVLAGIGVGWLIAWAMADLIQSLLPLPIWETDFQYGRFARGALLGLAIPLLASALPLRRALKLQPVDAIRTTAYGNRAGSSGSVLRKVRLPGRTYVSMSLRNVLRAPRRTLLTALGIAAAVTSAVAVLGLLDTFYATGDRNEAETTRSSPDRLLVTLDTVYPGVSEVPRTIARTPGVESVELQLRMPGELRAHGEEVDALVEVLDPGNEIWTPTVLRGTGEPGILLSEKAADDLSVAPGDTVELRHPQRTPDGFQLVTTKLPVSGLHPNPMRPFSYVDPSTGSMFGLTGATNEIVVVPKINVDRDGLQRTLLTQPGVAAVEPASSLADVLDEELSAFTGILRIIEVATLALALLIAFNSASISADERAREHATMFAFGLPPRVVLAMAVVENALIGLVGTLIGLLGGYAALTYLIGNFESVMPDLLIEPALTVTTVLTILTLGVLVVALAPVLTTRRERRMDIPAKLRVME